MRKRMKIFAGVVALALVFTVAAVAGKPDWQTAAEHLSNQIADSFVAHTPYPTSVLNGTSLERANLAERLVRFSTPGKIGYVYIFSALGKPLGYYTMRGKVSSTESQLTNPDQTFSCDGGTCDVASIGDDGTWGPEEGGSNGIFFFTTGGVMVETNLPFQYTDAPLPISVPSLNPKGKPSSTSQHWAQTHHH